MTVIDFQFATIQERLGQLKPRLIAQLETSPDEKVRALVSEASSVPLAGDHGGDKPLVIGVVGQYDAGKSTLLQCLTGRKDIRVSSDVCTDSVTAFAWNGIQILDTPGIHAGYKDHDESTYAAITASDLLLFVITNELFDETIGDHFRELVFNRKKAKETLLVVNKMSQDPGTPDIKRVDIEKVTRPLVMEDFGTVFIDAKCRIDSETAFDDEEKSELIKLSNFNALIEALNHFVQSQGLMGRTTTPIHGLRAISVQASDLLSTDSPIERMVLELLHQKRNRVLASRSHLRSIIAGQIGSAASAICVLGDRVAEGIEPESAQAEIEQKHKQALEEAVCISDQLSESLRESTEKEMRELQRQLDALRQGDLANRIAGSDSQPDPHRGMDPGFSAKPDWQMKRDGSPKPFDTQSTRKVAGIAEKIGDLDESATRQG